MSAHYVYVAWDADNRPLYVGCTQHPAQRMSQHARTGRLDGTARMTWTQYPDLASARGAERERIVALAPARNVHYNVAAWAETDVADSSVRERRAESLRRIRQERVA